MRFFAKENTEKSPQNHPAAKLRCAVVFNKEINAGFSKENEQNYPKNHKKSKIS